MQQENWFLSLACNIVLPILILNKLSLKIGPTQAVLLALAFPIAYGTYYLVRNRKVNFISVLGLLNVGVTGGLALSGLTGIWFAIKEAAFPALIGVFVFISSWTKRPFVETMLLNPQVMEVSKLEAKLQERSAQTAFHQMLQMGTRWLALSFFVSAILNFYFASKIFLEMDPTFTEEQKSLVLNDQIAQMTGWASLFTVLPSMIIMMVLLFTLLKRLEKITGESWQNFMKS